MRSHPVVVALIEQLLVSVLTSIANEIGPSGSGVDRLIASVLLIPISDEIIPIVLVSKGFKIGTGFRHLIVTEKNCTWIDTSSRAAYRVGYLLQILLCLTY